MNKELFDDAIGEVPPSTIDVDAVITRGRRAAWIRRVANPAVAAGVAVMLTVGAIAFTMTRGEGGAAGVGDQPTSSTEKPTTTAPSTSRAPLKTPPDGCSRPDLGSPAEIGARLTPVVRTAAEAQRPDLTFGPNPAEGLAGPHGALEFAYYNIDENAPDQPVCHKRAGFEAKATTEGTEGKGNVTIMVGAAFFDPRGFCEESSKGYCEEVAGPNGEAIVKYTPEGEEGVAPNVVVNTVYVLRQDGTLVWLRSENVPTSAMGGEQPTADRVPLDHDQLAEIGADPGLTLFP